MKYALADVAHLIEGDPMHQEVTVRFSVRAHVQVVDSMGGNPSRYLSHTDVPFSLPLTSSPKINKNIF